MLKQKNFFKLCTIYKMYLKPDNAVYKVNLSFGLLTILEPMNNILQIHLFFFLSLSELFCLFVVSVEGYCSSWSHVIRHARMRARTHTNTHIGKDYSGLVISPRQWPVPDNTILTRDRSLCPQRDSKLQSHQTSDSRPTPWTAWPALRETNQNRSYV